MARGRVAHLIEWKGWSAQQSGWELSPAEDEHYCCLPDELREARFAAGEWRGTEREATGWVYSLKVGLSEQAVNAQDWGRGTRWLLYHPGTEGQLREAHVGIERPLLGPVLTESNLVSPLPPATFHPGVAEQFAITEATLSAWSSLDDEELQPEDSTQGAFQLRGTEGTSRQGGWSSP